MRIIFRPTRSVLLLVFMVFVLGSCKSAKDMSSAQGSTKVTIPLSGKEYKSDKDYFRTSQNGKSTDLATAKKIALQNARTELASNIRSTLKAVIDNYTVQRTIGQQEEFTNKFEEESRTVVNELLNDVKIIGEEVYKEVDGKFTYWIAIEMSKNSLLQSVNNRISKNAKMQLDFDQSKFRLLFDEEMKKIENQ